MKTWKLVSGILSIVLFIVVAFQSCAAGLANALTENGESSGSAGIIVAIVMLAGGIVSIATRKSVGKGGNIAPALLAQAAAQTVAPQIQLLLHHRFHHILISSH